MFIASGLHLPVSGGHQGPDGSLPGPGPGASGHFAIWGGFNQNNQSLNGTFTFNVNGRFDDGRKISTHLVDHFNVPPTGAEFFFTHCHDSSLSTDPAPECPGLPTMFAGVAVTLTDQAADRFEGAGCSLYYDASDLFRIEGIAATLGDFETALSNGTASADIVGGV